MGFLRCLKLLLRISNASTIMKHDFYRSFWVVKSNLFILLLTKRLEEKTSQHLINILS